VLAVLSLQSCSESPIMGVLFCLTFSCLSRSHCLVLAVLLWLSFSGGPLFPVLPRQAYPSSHVLAAPFGQGLSWLSSPGKPCPGSPFLAVLSW
jgi:hypothetical protein